MPESPSRMHTIARLRAFRDGTTTPDPPGPGVATTAKQPLGNYRELIVIERKAYDIAEETE